MSREVFVLISGGKYERYYVIGAYSSKELAIESARKVAMEDREDSEVEKEDIEELIEELGIETHLEFHGFEEPEFFRIFRLQVDKEGGDS